MPKSLPVDTLLARGKKFLKNGDWANAHTSYVSVLQRFPANVRAKKGLDSLKSLALTQLIENGNAAKGDRRWADAVQNFLVAFDLAPEILSIGHALAECQLELGDAPALMRTSEAILNHEPNSSDALNFLGLAQGWMGKSDDAQESFTAALRLNPTDTQALNNLGALARARGHKTAAQDFFRKALDVEPDNPALHYNLSQEIAYTRDEPHLEEMLALLSASHSDDVKFAGLHFAVFEALDDLGETEQAFGHLRKGNRLTKTALNYHFKKDAIPALLGKSLMNKPMEDDSSGDSIRPIFVTGLPRSGTTLVERILGRVRGVQTCGELTVIQQAVVQTMRKVTSRNEKSLTRDDIRSLALGIRTSLSEYSDGSPILIDKMPLNFRWIGYICAALPEARIVHISRDPMATAWSMYRRLFNARGNGFTYDPNDLVRIFVLHRDLMDHWHKLFPDRVFELDYQDLVKDPLKITQELTKSVGLEWSPDCLTPEHATNQVYTASAGQVHRPIYLGSNETWKRYEMHLEVLPSALKSSGFSVT